MAVSRIFDLLDNYDNFPDVKIAFAEKLDGKWERYSPQQYKETSIHFAIGLLALGVKKGDKIASISINCPQWNFIDMGIALIGAIHVPLYPSFSDKELKYVLSHAEPVLLLVSDSQIFEPVKSAISDVLTLKNIYTFMEVTGLKNWEIIIKLGESEKELYFNKLQSVMKEIKPDDLATIIYTSGTTGISKGVMLSHDNLITNAIAVARRQHLKTGAEILSFLPLCHVYERMINYQYQYLGISLYYAENMNMIADNLKELKLDGFTAVPRIFEKIYEKLVIEGRKLSWFPRQIFFRALNLALEYKINGNTFFYNIQHKLFDKLVYSKWRNALGGKISCAGVGGAACRPNLIRLFWAAGIPVYEGYGLTETSPIISVNYGKPESSHLNKTLKIGSTGKILENVKVKIGDDGEILVKGPNVMKGYYKDTEKSKSVFDENGWFRTGDIGLIDNEGFLVITGRKKDLFKTSWGKYIAPQYIEYIFRKSFLIGHIMVIGENRKFTSAVISPDFQHLYDWCRQHNINYENNIDLINIPRILALYSKEISIINKTLGRSERIKTFRLVSELWSPETGELTPTQKLKRKNIFEKYSDLIEKMYSQI
ncbi:AMP-dependent synthetase/ligase [Bacteroidota bacterium]